MVTIYTFPFSSRRRCVSYGCLDRQHSPWFCERHNHREPCAGSGKSWFSTVSQRCITVRELGDPLDSVFSHPNLCTNGVTVSIWVMALQPRHSDRTIVFDNGGMLADSAGFTLRRMPDYAMEVLIQDGNGFSKISTLAGSWIQDRWVHITFSWYPGWKIRLYVNGCDVDEGDRKGFATTFGRIYSFAGFRPLYLGKYDGGSWYAHIKLDQLQFWYEVLPRASIWKLYSKGG